MVSYFFYLRESMLIVKDTHRGKHMLPHTLYLLFFGLSVYLASLPVWTAADNYYICVLCVLPCSVYLRNSERDIRQRSGLVKTFLKV